MTTDTKTLNPLAFCVRTLLRGGGQVMFQCNAWTGLLFLCGIFWGSYETGSPQVAWGALVGVAASTVAGFLFSNRGCAPTDGEQGLWGFNGILVGCAFPTFMANTWTMWLALVICAMTTTWVRQGFNNVMAPWKINSLTFPFVFMTWLFLWCAREMTGLAPAGMSAPTDEFHVVSAFDSSFGSLVVYWLKGIAQVFLIDSWVTGIFFLAALAVSSWVAAVWAAVGSAIALAVAIIFGVSGASLEEGLYGFSAVLTAIALGCTFYKPNIASAVWCVIGTIVTVFVQAGMNALMAPWGLATLTGPFCLTTWLFLLPRFKMDDRPLPDLSEWNKLND